jgi:hypothetical protein
MRGDEPWEHDENWTFASLPHMRGDEPFIALDRDTQTQPHKRGDKPQKLLRHDR